jgi:hypothetical protein
VKKLRTLLIRAEGFNTLPLRAVKKGIKLRMQPLREINIPRPEGRGMLIGAHPEACELAGHVAALSPEIRDILLGL